MTRAALLVVGMTLAAGGFAYAQTAEEQAACRGDGFRLCRTHVGKPDDMKKCLVSNKDQLSTTCRKIVESRGG